MDAWWQALPIELQVFYGFAFIGTVMMFVQTAMLIVGVGHADIPHGDTGDAHGGLSMISLRTMIAFLTGFGWIGVIAIRLGAPVWLASVAGFAAGLLLAYSMVWMLRAMRRFNADGSLDYANAVGGVGTVIVSIQPAGKGGGQVEIMVQGRLAAVQAITAEPSDSPIPSGTKVRVTALSDATTLRVTPA